MPTTTFNFLVGDERYEAELPAAFELREAVTTVTLGGMWRNLVFRPRAADDPERRPNLEHVADRSAPNGVRVGIYRQTEPPQVEALVWRPGNGAIVAGFNPQQRDQLDLYLDAIRVADGEIPRVAYSPPFGAGDPRDEQQRERLVFAAGGTDEDEQVIHIARPTRRLQRRPEMPRHLAARAAASDAGPTVRWMARAERAAAIEAGVDRIAQSLRRVR